MNLKAKQHNPQVAQVLHDIRQFKLSVRLMELLREGLTRETFEKAWEQASKEPYDYGKKKENLRMVV